MKKILIKTLIGISFINNLNLYAQKKDYIVKQNNDTIYVQKVKLKYDEIKVKEKVILLAMFIKCVKLK